MKVLRLTLPLALAGTVLIGAGIAPAATVSLHRGENVAAAEAAALKAGDTVAVNVKSAVLRGGPSTKSKKLASMVKGTKLTVVGVENDGWLKVKGPQGQGFVSARLVK